MTSKRVFYIMIACIAILSIAIASSAYGGSQLIGSQGRKLSNLKAESASIETQQASLVRAKKDIQQYDELNTITKSIVPQDKDQARTVREITKIANESGIELKTIAFQNSNLGQTPTPAPKPEANSDDKTKQPTSPAVPTISQVVPVEGIPGVFSLPITISTPDDAPVSYQNFLDFLQRLESNRRTAHVDQISITPSGGGRKLTFTLTLNAYVKP